MASVLISAAQLGFAWDEEEKGWVRVSLPPLRMITGHCATFLLFYFGCFGVISVFAELWLRGKGFPGSSSLRILKVLYNYLPLPTCENEIKCC